MTKRQTAAETTICLAKLMMDLQEYRMMEHFFLKEVLAAVVLCCSSRASEAIANGLQIIAIFSAPAVSGTDPPENYARNHTNGIGCL